MFGKKDNHNPFLSRMEDYHKKALESCSDSIKPIITDFYTKCRKSKVKWNGDAVDWNIERTLEAVHYFAENTNQGEIIEGEDLQCVKGIMQEMDKFYAEVLEKSNQEDKDNYWSNRTVQKMQLFSEIFCKNMVGMKYGRQDENNIHDGKIFERYRDLYLIISLVNEHYDELAAKGFGLHSVWYPFWEVFKQARNNGTPLTEDEKLTSFIGLVNGTMKFHPVYETKAVGYAVKPSDFEETIIVQPKSQYDNAKALQQTDVMFNVEGEGSQRKLTRK